MGLARLSKKSWSLVLISFCISVYQYDVPVIATLGLSWNLSLAEDLESLSLQDGPLSGIIFGLDPPTHHQIANVWILNYPSNPWSYHPQMLTLDFWDQTKAYMCFKLRQNALEDDPKILKYEYLRNNFFFFFSPNFCHSPISTSTQVGSDKVISQTTHTTPPTPPNKRKT